MQPHCTNIVPTYIVPIYIIHIVLLSNVQVNMHIRDLFTELSDGVALLKLLEVLSGEVVGKPNRGVMRVQRVENVARYVQSCDRSQCVLENSPPYFHLCITPVFNFRFNTHFLYLERNNTLGTLRAPAQN